MLYKISVICALSLFSFLAYAAPAINIQTKYYPVMGNNSKSILQSINSRGPVGKNGKRFHALTKWQVQWSYRWLESGSRCRLTETTVNLDVEYLLPELQQPETISESLATNWDNYYSALYSHEQQHKDFGVQAATELDKELLSIEKKQNCNRLEKQIADTAQKVLDKYDQIEKEFDRVTNHGINQGVKFP